MARLISESKTTGPGEIFHSRFIPAILFFNLQSNLFPKAIEGRIEFFFVLRCGCFLCLQKKVKQFPRKDEVSMEDKIFVGVEIILLIDRNNHYRRALMRTEKQTVACQFPKVSLPEYTLFALLLFFMSKLAVTHFVCYSSASAVKKEKKQHGAHGWK